MIPQPAVAGLPNIVIILADDMGYDAVSVNNPAMGKLKTPNIDRLASQGMNFHDAHSASAVCTPTRYGLLTGRYAWIEGRHVTATPSVPKPKDLFGTDGLMLPGWKLEEILPELGRRSADWIQEQAKAEKPFFLYLSLTSPHTPISPSPPFQGKSGISPFADFIIETDAVVGQVVDALDATGVAEDTLLIFTSDNGTASAARFRGLERHGVDLRHTFTGIKGELQERGHRVPFIVRWPGKTPTGSTCRELICLNDLMATTAEMLGVKLPAGASPDGISILSVLTGKVERLPDRPPVVHHDYKGNFAIRHGKWKLVGNKLFDMEADPKEQTDLAAAHSETAQRLAAALAACQAGEGGMEIGD